MISRPVCVCLALAACSSDASAPSSPDASVLPDAAPDAPAVVFAPVPVPGTTRVLTQTIQAGGRDIVLFVPAFDYDHRAATLLFLNDGQDVVALGLARTLDALWGASSTGPVVVAALPIVDRLQDYGTAEHDVAIACDQGGGPLLGTKAADYGRFIVDDALPAVAQAVGLAPAPARTGFLGASLGGLSAFAIAWDHPEVFGFAGALSGSFWWRTTSGTVEQRQSSRIMPAIVARSPGRPGFRAWFEAGTHDETDDRDGDGIIDAIDDTLDLVAAMKGVGFVDGPDLVYEQVEGGIHGYPTWSLVLPDFLRWATPPAVN